MGYDRNKVIAIAKAEVGYLEKKTGDLKYLYNKTANAGYNNYTKYGYEMHKIYPAVMDYPAPWCSCYFDWCTQKAYGIATAKGILQRNFDDYTVAAAMAYQKHNALDKKPQVGDQIFFSKNNTVGSIYHTGLVYKVDSSHVYTIEGNTSNAGGVVPNGGGVRMKSYSRSSIAISRAFFGHPKYDDGYGEKKTTSTTKIVEVKKVNEKTYKVKAKNGQTYTVFNVSYGDQGEVVKFLQQLLNAALAKHGVNFKVTEDGICGDKTLEAIAKYQLIKRGIACGKGTWTSLLKEID